jgi:hypothetical protein
LTDEQARGLGQAGSFRVSLRYSQRSGRTDSNKCEKMRKPDTGFAIFSQD